MKNNNVRDFLANERTDAKKKIRISIVISQPNCWFLVPCCSRKPKNYTFPCNISMMAIHGMNIITYFAWMIFVQFPFGRLMYELFAFHVSFSHPDSRTRCALHRQIEITMRRWNPFRKKFISSCARRQNVNNISLTMHPAGEFERKEERQACQL